jgi:ABC-type transport system substrate-binding protein
MHRDRRTHLHCDLAAIALVGAGLALVAGCGDQRRPQTPGAENPQRGGTFTMSQDSPETLDPARVDDVYEATLVNQIFNGLLAYDSHLNTVPCIASSWVISPDGMSYTFQLRKGVKFHDGSELSAEDVVYSLSRVFDLPEAQSSLARTYLGHILGVDEYTHHKTKVIRGFEILSPHIVRIRLARPYSSFLGALASEFARIVPKHYLDRVGSEEFGHHPIGCGPFQLAEWTPGQRIVMTRFRDYAFTPSWLDSLVFQLPVENARDLAADQFLRGELSAAVIPDGRLQEFVTRPNTTLLARQYLSLMFIGLNARQAPFTDPRVRQAFAMAIDREALIRAHPEGRTLPNGMLPPGMPGYTPEPKLLPHDLRRARELLAQAGYPGGAGLPPIIYTTAVTTHSARQLFAELQRQVAALGFDLRLAELPWLDFSRHLIATELQCLSVTWVADIPDPDSFLYAMCTSGGSANFTAYSSPEVDALLEQGRASRSQLQRLEIYRDAERRILSDASVIPLFHPVSAIAVRADVRGLHMTAMGVGSLALEKVWLAPVDSVGQLAAERGTAGGAAENRRGEPPTTRDVMMGRMQ